MTPSQKANILAEALPYLRAFHGKVLVIRFGGQAMADPALKAGFARDVALLRLVGMKPIVVHGGGWGIDELMRKMGQQSTRYRGHRITDERTLTIVEMALSELNQELTSLINREGGRAVGLDGQDGRFIHARPMAAPADDPGAPDLGFLGDVERIDTTLIELLLSRNFVPVVMPIGVGADGTTYHINSDLLAGRLARALEAEKLVLMTNIAGVLGRNGQVTPIMTASEAEALVREGVVHGGMEPRVNAALRAVREGVRSVHIIDGGVPSALLLEVLTAEGVGTALRSDASPNFFSDSQAYILSPT
jgi:acetylglutamate kinase